MFYFFIFGLFINKKDKTGIFINKKDKTGIFINKKDKTAVKIMYGRGRLTEYQFVSA